MGQAIEDAFSVEPVTKEFFETYRDIFNHVKAEIGGFGDSDEEQEAKHVFTQTLFNRLMFVYFLSRKGWLRFNGDADYLNALWRDYGSLSSDHNFYTVRAETLFFAGLNNPQSRDVNKGNEGTLPVIGPVPFLNGGLFEQTDLDRRKGIAVPDDVIHCILTGLFDRFNFTVMESTPFDVEVAVDPEMLGKVFEELVTERHASGAYYTPRPVVSFMCREALKGYLEGKETGASAEAIAAFVDRHDTEGIGVAEARSISRSLEEVTVVDPACGSGAYLLGMMQELIELQNTLYNVGVDAKSLYDLKLEIIQRNLYGVDIDDFAVNIAMLRLWLSLAIDYDRDDPQPLPNLDFKVLCGDSLLGPDPSAGVEVQGTLGQDIEQFRRLGELKGKYMRASTGHDKERLRAEIRETEAGIREALGAGGADEGAIDWRVEFSEIFAIEGGFNVVIGNPPYVESRSSAISEALKDSYMGQMQRDWGETLPRGSDLLMYFYPRSVKLLSENGYGSFITQNAWLNTDYGQKFQQFSIGRFSFLKIIDSSTKFFTNVDSQNINAVISVFTKGSSPIVEYGIADSEMTVTPRGKIPANSPMKWGALLVLQRRVN
jgi:type I restriction-modification system DNA methylase subunit